jgi:hypothetical protein
VANAQTTGKIYIDSTGLVTDQSTKIAYILFTTDAANDQMILKETSSGSTCVNIRGALAKHTYIFDFADIPMIFGNGVYVSTLSANATATLVTTKSGGA